MIRFGQALRRLSQDIHDEIAPPHVEGPTVVDHHAVGGAAQLTHRGNPETRLFLKLPHQGGLRIFPGLDPPAG
jgi:hypothetical protein